MHMQVIEAVERVNNEQKHILFKKLSAAMGGAEALRGATIAIWGLAFKPETDDMREAPSLVLIDELLAAGCKVKAYDPIAMNEAKRRIGDDKIAFAKDIYDASFEADALVIVTEWKEFRLPSWPVIRKAMRGNVVVDGRNIFDPAELNAAGLSYYNIGHRPAIVR